MKTKLPYVEVNQSWKLKYPRNCTQKTAESFTVALSGEDLLNLVLKIIG